MIAMLPGHCNCNNWQHYLVTTSVDIITSCEINSRVIIQVPLRLTRNPAGFRPPLALAFGSSNSKTGKKASVSGLVSLLATADTVLVTTANPRCRSTGLVQGPAHDDDGRPTGLAGARPTMMMGGPSVRPGPGPP